MLFSLRSIVLFSSLTAASVFVCGVAAVPVPRLPDDPVVTPGAVLTPAPEDCAVPALLVPGAVGAPLAALLLPAVAPLVLCAIKLAGKIRIAPTAIAAIADALIIENLRLPFNRHAARLFRELSARPTVELVHWPTAGADCACVS
jgi:hypothetical protein